MAYNKDLDYMALIQNAEKEGDLHAAAQYERARNEKIQAEGLNYATTNNYGQYLTPQNYTGSSNNVYVFDDNQSAIQKQMNQNSIDWWTADNAGRATLEEANRQLAAMLGEGVTFDSASGYWSGVADAPASVKTGVDFSQPNFDYNAWLDGNPKPNFDALYGPQLEAKLNEILNRDKFSYNAETDPLYQQYREQYNREGSRAMNDTLASAAINAGGMNSYAMTAAQQANDYYSSQLTDKIPELYQMAYQMYLDDIDLQVQDLGLLQNMDNTQYNRYRDTMSDWRDDLDFAYGMYRDDMADYKWGTEFNYGVSRDDVADKRYDLEWQYNVGRDQIADSRYDKEWEYGVSRDEVADGRYENETAYDRAMDLLLQGVMPNSALLQSAGISSAEAQALYNANVETAKSPVSNPVSNPTGGPTKEEEEEEDDGNGDGNDNDTGGGKVGDAILLDKIHGVPEAEWNERAVNENEVDAMCAELYRTQGRDAVLKMLVHEARPALTPYAFARLYRKYRDME